LIAIVDSGPLYSAIDTGDADHAESIDVLGRSELELVVPTLVVAEVCHFVGRRLGANVEARFLRSLTDIEVESPSEDDWSRIADLVDEYADFPLGGADASVVALAERLDTDIVITLDRRHFSAVRPRHCTAFSLLPA
jgi:uncharacterized protein